MDRMIRDAGQHVPWITFGIDSVWLGTADQAVDRRGIFSTTIGARKKKILSAQNHGPQRSSAALLSISMPPSSQKRSSASHRPSA